MVSLFVGLSTPAFARTEVGDTTVQHRFKSHLIAPKGGWQCGLSVMYMDFSSDDTDYMQWFMIPNTKTVPVPGYCGQQGMAGYQRIVTSVEYHKYDRKDSRISDMIKFEKEDGETILPRKLNIEELKLWFNHKIMANPYKYDPKYYTNNIKE